MRTVTLGSIVMAFLIFTACQSNTKTDKQAQDSLAVIHENYVDTIHTSQNSLDWQGTYEGVIPCADCPGIKTTVELKNDETFAYQATYLERDFALTDSGTFMWHNHGSIIHIQGEKTDMKFKVGENRLFQLDQNDEQITGELAEYYILTKIK